jgi:phenylalanyl-tRNA synthetase beta chain
MKISTNSIRSFNDRYHTASSPVSNGIDELVEKIGAQLGGIEEVVSFGARFEGIPVIKIVSCVDHPNSDHLHICKVDDGGVIKDVPRDSEGLVQIVTGAPNVRDGFVGAWLPPGVTVPESLGKDPFVLEARALRGETSYGMLASAKELTLGDDHNGIMELDANIVPGTWLADAYDLRDDYLIDIENKMFTHRPDCFGFMGVARELSAIYHTPFKSPDWYTQNPTFPDIETDALPLSVTNDIPDLVPRFVAITMRNVEIKPSPIWLQIELAKYGIRAINNLVDYSNFFMLETGQPIHIYDYDKVKALGDSAEVHLVVRNPKKGEKLTLLNGKTIEPTGKTMMVATDKQSVCLGGAMGGENSEVDEHTKNIIIEAANWDMYTMRRTSMAYGIFSDAVTRFTKGQSPLQNLAVLAKIVDEIRRSAGGLVASHVIDNNHLSEEVTKRGNINAPVNVTRNFIADRLGLAISSKEMAGILRNAEFLVETQADNLLVRAPFWRTDIAIAEDIVEEVGRLYGYDKLPLTLPKRTVAPAVRNVMYDVKTRVANYLRQSGANEVVTYSFVHGRLLQQVGQKAELAFRLSNALSPDLQYYRLSLTPSLLDKLHANSRAGYESFALFECSKVHSKTEIDQTGLPLESERIAFAFAADGKAAKQYVGAPYYQAKKYLAGLLQSFGLEQEIRCQALSEAVFTGNDSLEQMCRPFEPARAAVLRRDDHIVGVVGEYRTSVAKALKLPKVCSGFELLSASLETSNNQTYVALPRFPKVEQDICLRLPIDIPYQQLYDFVWAQIIATQPENVYSTLTPVDIYQREGDEVKRQITLRLGIASYERTLTDTVVNKILDTVADAAHRELSAERV